LIGCCLHFLRAEMRRSCTEWQFSSGKQRRLRTTQLRSGAAMSRCARSVVRGGLRAPSAHSGGQINRGGITDTARADRSARWRARPSRTTITSTNRRTKEAMSSLPRTRTRSIRSFDPRNPRHAAATRSVPRVTQLESDAVGRCDTAGLCDRRGARRRRGG
jgi:hypothetical protein